jgi:hypothetical protein
MEENNLRVLRPWRHWLPSPSWFQYASRMRRLNSYIIGIMRERWAARAAGALTPAKPDLLDRILLAIEVPFMLRTSWITNQGFLLRNVFWHAMSFNSQGGVWWHRSAERNGVQPLRPSCATR